MSKSSILINKIDEFHSSTQVANRLPHGIDYNGIEDLRKKLDYARKVGSHKLVSLLIKMIDKRRNQ